MTKLDFYIARNVIAATLLVLLILSGLDLLFTAIDEFGDTNDNYTVLDALWFVLLQFPTHLYEFLPMAALIGALSGLGILASSNELVVMQASGVSNARIVWAVMKPALLLMLLGLVLGEWVVPNLQVRAEVY
ncbi:MAG: LptF/LptG family permease, partial [Pseudomonadales bacterium]|nr:LptF/LptG family permease [Pseudomonadales bacterium]